MMRFIDLTFIKRQIQFIIWFTIGLTLCLFIHLTPALSQSLTQAQTLDAQAQAQLAQGNAEIALQSWQKAETLYRQFNAPTEALGTQLNQSKALYALGYYRRAQALLAQLETPLLQQPNSKLKANGFLTIGTVLRRVGEFDRSQQQLKQSLAIAEQIQSQSDRQAAYFQLGNTLLEQKQLEPALIRFRQAAEIPSGVQLPALLNQLKLLIQTEQRSQTEPIVTQIRSLLAQQPINSTTIYAQIEFAEHLTKLSQTRSAAEGLAIAIQQSQQINNQRAQSYALGRLAHLYEQLQQWNDAKTTNQQARTIAQSINAPDILYQWQWQSGRIRNTTGDRTGAIEDYRQAIKTLQGLRDDLVAVASEVQFSFREQVEPVYREFVSLLLARASEPNLIEARDLIESLQLEELNNFFREACLTAVAQPIDQVDQQAAVFYPIILNDRLDLIVSLPGKTLKHYSTRLPRAEIEAGIDRMLQSMRSTSFETERLAASQELYRWLIQPAIADLDRQSIKTLVFILDGALKSVPMAALHSGKQYLIEEYAIALTPSLQLMNPRSLPKDQLKVLVGGLSKANQGSTPLPSVETEILQIKNLLQTTVLENETFTNTKLQQKLKTKAFSVVHLATHGQFSSTAKDTFIQTWNGRINVDDLRSYLTQRDLSDSAAIELLVLSACQTAQGDDRAALGMAGVAIRSGARSTLASLWTVNDASTAEFVTQFYQGLTQNQLTRAEAVRQAQLTLLRNPNYNHPYYWAAFTLIGSWL
jgi:CHAT domain-containing protein